MSTYDTLSEGARLIFPFLDCFIGVYFRAWLDETTQCFIKNAKIREMSKNPFCVTPCGSPDTQIGNHSPKCKLWDSSTICKTLLSAKVARRLDRYIGHSQNLPALDTLLRLIQYCNMSIIWQELQQLIYQECWALKQNFSILYTLANILAIAYICW